MSKEFSSMNIENQQFPHSPIEPTDRRIVEYPSLVDIVQLSAARKLGIQGSIAAKSFDQLLLHKDDIAREALTDSVGSRFDEELINFVVGSIIGKKSHETIILAEESEGIEGHLPWETPLLNRISQLQKNGLLNGIEVRVERYSDNYSTVEELTSQNNENTNNSDPQKV